MLRHGTHKFFQVGLSQFASISINIYRKLPTYYLISWFKIIIILLRAGFMRSSVILIRAAAAAAVLLFFFFANWLTIFCYSVLPLWMLHLKFLFLIHLPDMCNIIVYVLTYKRDSCNWMSAGINPFFSIVPCSTLFCHRSYYITLYLKGLKR